MKFLDLLGVERAQSNFGLLSSLKNILLQRVNSLPVNELDELLETTYPYIGFAELRSIPLAVMSRHPNIPVPLLKSLNDQLELLHIQVPVQIMRQIWKLEEKSWLEAIKPLISAYIKQSSVSWSIRSKQQLRLKQREDYTQTIIRSSSAQVSSLTEASDSQADFSNYSNLNPSLSTSGLHHPSFDHRNTQSELDFDKDEAEDALLFDTFSNFSSCLISNPSQQTINLISLEGLQILSGSLDSLNGNNEDVAIVAQILPTKRNFTLSTMKAIHNSYSSSYDRESNLPLLLLSDYIGDDSQLYFSFLAFLRKLIYEITSFNSKHRPSNTQTQSSESKSSATDAKTATKTDHLKIPIETFKKSFPLLSSLGILDVFTLYDVKSQSSTDSNEAMETDQDNKDKSIFAYGIHPQLLSILSSLRFDTLMMQHDRNNRVNCDNDELYRFTWCLDACIREKNVEDRHFDEMEDIFSNLQKRIGILMKNLSTTSTTSATTSGNVSHSLVASSSLQTSASSSSKAPVITATSSTKLKIGAPQMDTTSSKPSRVTRSSIQKSDTPSHDDKLDELQSNKTSKKATKKSAQQQSTASITESMTREQKREAARRSIQESLKEEGQDTDDEDYVSDEENRTSKSRARPNRLKSRKLNEKSTPYDDKLDSKRDKRSRRSRNVDDEEFEDFDETESEEEDEDYSYSKKKRDQEDDEDFEISDSSSVVEDEEEEKIEATEFLSDDEDEMLVRPRNRIKRKSVTKPKTLKIKKEQEFGLRGLTGSASLVQKSAENFSLHGDSSSTKPQSNTNPSSTQPTANPLQTAAIRLKRGDKILFDANSLSSKAQDAFLSQISQYELTETINCIVEMSKILSTGPCQTTFLQVLSTKLKEISQRFSKPVSPSMIDHQADLDAIKKIISADKYICKLITLLDFSLTNLSLILPNLENFDSSSSSQLHQFLSDHKGLNSLLVTSLSKLIGKGAKNEHFEAILNVLSLITQINAYKDRNISRTMMKEAIKNSGDSDIIEAEEKRVEAMKEKSELENQAAGEKFPIDFLNNLLQNLDSIMVFDQSSPQRASIMVFLYWTLIQAGSGEDEITNFVADWLCSSKNPTLANPKQDIYPENKRLVLLSYPLFIQEVLFGFARSQSPEIIELRAKIVEQIFVNLKATTTTTTMGTLEYQSTSDGGHLNGEMSSTSNDELSSDLLLLTSPFSTLQFMSFIWMSRAFGSLNNEHAKNLLDHLFVSGIFDYNQQCCQKMSNLSSKNTKIEGAMTRIYEAFKTTLQTSLN